MRISDGLKLPIDAVTQRISILGKTRSGKSHTAGVLVEEVLKAEQQVVILDPKGDWWGLRSSADGKSEGLPITIMGGTHGDVPLEPTAGALIADIVVNNIDLTAELEKSIEEKVVKEQRALAKVFEMQAAQKDADMVLIKARAEAESVQIRGAAVAKNPQVVVLEAINRWDGKAPQTLMLDRSAIPVFPVSQP